MKIQGIAKKYYDKKTRLGGVWSLVRIQSSRRIGNKKRSQINICERFIFLM